MFSSALLIMEFNLMLLSGLYQFFFLIRNLRLIGNISHLLVNVQLVLMSYVSESGFSE